VVVADPDLDLAILKIDQPFDGQLSCFSVQNAGASAVGARIFAAGFPYSGILSSDAKITEGVVSSKNGIGGDPKTFQISAAIQPGNSGGPVFDETGKLVGIAVSKLKFGQNVNFAIKPLYLRALMESVETNANCIAEFKSGAQSPSGFERTLALVENYQ
jgi:S1-C subfamily serine protease